MCMPRRSVISDSLQTHGLYPTRLLCPWESPGKTTGVGCHARFLGLPDPRIKPESLMSPALASGFFTTSTTWEAQKRSLLVIYFIYTLYFVINHCIFPLQYLQHFTRLSVLPSLAQTDRNSISMKKELLRKECFSSMEFTWI